MNKKVEIKDQLWYADKGELGAVRFHTLNNKKLEYDKDAWDELRFGMVCTDPATFGEVQRVAEVLCSYYGYCEYQEVQDTIKVLKYMRKMGTAQRQRISSEIINNEVEYE